MATTQSVAIVGAGMAGASAAAALHKAGLAVTLFELRRGPSGRMSTRRTDHWQADHGAQYFTAKSPAFQAEVQTWCQEGWAALWKGRIAKLDLIKGRPQGKEDSTQDNLVFEPTTPSPRYVGTPRMTSIVASMLAPLA
ncbi:MAG: FAD-dependent oxidoreductase, partial [Burkholderiaceae bacterium]